MKEKYLLLGICSLFIIWLDNIYLSLVLVLCIGIYVIRHYPNTLLFFVLLSTLFIRFHIHIPNAVPSSKILQVKEIKSNYIIAHVEHQDVIVFQANNVNFGDIIEVSGRYEKVDGIHNFSMFHFPTWLKRRNIQFQITAKDCILKKAGTNVRHKLYASVQDISDESARNWILAMIYGIQKEDDASFFITSSGLHISYLFYLLQEVLLLCFSRNMSNLLCFFGIGLVGFVTYMSTSLLRILCFKGVSLNKGSLSAFDVLGVSMVITLSIFPYMGFELAFILPVLFRLSQLFNIQKRSKRFVNYLILIPVQFIFFHSVNIVQIFFFRFLRICYAFLYAVAFVSLLFSTSFLYHLILPIFMFLKNIETVGFSIFYTPHIIWLCCWVKCAFDCISYRGYKSMVKLCSLLCFAPVASYSDPFGEVYIMDVGQGDCALIKLPYHQGVLLIDVMGSLYKNIPKDIIVPVLKAKGIHHIDKVILTHDDYDHSGGLKELQALMEVKEVISKKQKDTYLASLHIPFMLHEYSGKDGNDNSIITYLEVFENRFLFMGDAGVASEKALLNEYPKLSVDVLKVGHHGSKTSSSLPFLHQLQPKLAIISSGRGNLYGHPHKETLDNLKRENIYYVNTAQKGAISIKFCKYFSFYKTAEHEFGIIKHR
ncbi:MAG: MBL fold metallo-hydrolase [Longicatena sp.]